MRKCRDCEFFIKYKDGKGVCGLLLKVVNEDEESCWRFIKRVEVGEKK